MPTAIQAMRRELSKIQAAQSQCITDEGLVRNEMRYRYQELTRKAKAFKESIDWLESMYAINQDRASKGHLNVI